MQEKRGAYNTSYMNKLKMVDIEEELMVAMLLSSQFIFLIGLILLFPIWIMPYIFVKALEFFDDYLEERDYKLRMSGKKPKRGHDWY